MKKDDIARKLVTEDLLLEVMPAALLQQLQAKVQEILKQKHGVDVPMAIVDGIPVEIFAQKCSPAEAIVKYLKEERGLNFHDIGEALARDERGVWGSYNRSKKKMPERFDVSGMKTFMPLEVFKNRSKSILEIVISYLHTELTLKFSKIAKLLDKKYSTIYTTYLRGTKK